MSTLHIREIDANHFEELFATRTELHTVPPAVAGEVATEGRVVFHTEWLVYSYGQLLARKLGPRIEHSFGALMERTWAVDTGDDTIEVPTTLLMAAIKTAFVTIANETMIPLPVPVAPTQETAE